jgi:hypothetical protein
VDGRKLYNFHRSNKWWLKLDSAVDCGAGNFPHSGILHPQVYSKHCQKMYPEFLWVVCRLCNCAGTDYVGNGASSSDGKPNPHILSSSLDNTCGLLRSMFNSFMLQEVVCCAPHWTVNGYGTQFQWLQAFFSLLYGYVVF